MKSRIFVVCLFSLMLCPVVYGQAAQPQSPQPQPSENPEGVDADMKRQMREHMRREITNGIHRGVTNGIREGIATGLSRAIGMPSEGMPSGKWWKNAEIVKELQLSDDQLQRLEQAFQESRLHLIDLHAALEKEEVLLEPMTEADNPDESQVDSQIDKVASARAELEKAHTRMLLNVRKVLTADQWKKLRSMPGEFGPMPRMHHLMGPELPAPPPPPAGSSQPR